jgi:hypothetical protein
MEIAALGAVLFVLLGVRRDLSAMLGLVRDLLPALVDSGMKRARCRERDVPANGFCHERIGMVIASNPDPGARGRWAAW